MLENKLYTLKILSAKSKQMKLKILDLSLIKVVYKNMWSQNVNT